MSHLIIWAPAAREDMRAIHAYISKDSRRYARAMLRRILVSVSRLKDFPRIGRCVPEFGELDEIRELIVRNYRVIYRISSESIAVGAVIHGARELRPALDDRQV